MQDALSFVLPVALSGTGRPGSDLDRLDMLLSSFLANFQLAAVGSFTVITRPDDFAVVRERLRSFTQIPSIQLINECDLCPELNADPETIDSWPVSNKGWYRQQLLKLAWSEHVRTEFYMTLDSDVLFTKPFSPSTLIRDGKSLVNTQSFADYATLWVPATAREEAQIRLCRDQDSERILRMSRTDRTFYGETPVILNTGIVRDMLSHLESLSSLNWLEYLITQLPWTELSLYFTFAEASGLFDRYHSKGDFDAVLCMSDSLWLSREHYKDGRDLSSWRLHQTGSESVAVVVQSYLGFSCGAVRARAAELDIAVRAANSAPRESEVASEAKSDYAVSVIVAAYNAAPYITECLDSLVHQTLRSLEVIVVDDGSTDGTREILTRYEAAFPTIRVIYQENRGTGAVRNLGIKEARGEYIGFVDSDDWVEKDTYEVLYREAEHYRVNQVICNGTLFDHVNRGTRPFPDSEFVNKFSKYYDGLIDPLQSEDIFLLDASACKRLYRAEYLYSRSFRFSEDSIFEDITAHFELLLHGGRVRVIDRPFYHYRTGHPGRATDRKDKRLLEVIDIMSRVMDMLDDSGAHASLWANFIRYQDWVLRWLCGQIEERFARAFAQGACRLGQRFPSEGVQVFRDKFRMDEDSQRRVRLQLDGRAEAYLTSVRGSGYEDMPGALAAAETTLMTRKLRVPILAYHSIADDGPPELRDWRITPADFQEQLRFLQQHGYRSISLEEWARCIAAKAPPAGRPVIITFDDGYADFLMEAAPRLEAAGFRATVFVVTGRVGAYADWDATSGPPLRLMNWDDLRALEARGFAIGSHMSAHRDLTLSSDNEIEQDGREALAALRRELGHAVACVAFPWGSSDSRVRAALLRAGYQIGVEIGERGSTLSDDPCCLPRIEIHADDDIAAFARKLGEGEALVPIPNDAVTTCAPGPAVTKLFTAIYNDARILPHFLQHYLACGITEFFIASEPAFRSAVQALAESYNITVWETPDVVDHFLGGAAPVTEMRRRFQDAAEWAVLVDLDEFVEFGSELPSIVEQAEREGANVVRAVMWDRFSRDGRVIGFEPGSDLRRLFPIRARFIKDVMHGGDYKGVLIKGLLESEVAHHSFVGQIVCSRQLDLSHYKWFDGAIDRVRAAYRMLTDAGRPWASEFQRVLDHYARHGRFAWEEFGGTPDPLLAEVDEIVDLAETIPGWTEGEDAAEIARASLAFQGDPVIVEVGVFLGRCTVLLAGPRRWRGTGMVHCVDPFDGSGDAFSVPYYRRILDSLGGGTLRDHFDTNIASASLSDFVRVHEGRAADVAAEWNQPIDLLLLDGDQSPEGARAAYLAWEPHLKPGGILVLRNAAVRGYAEGHDGHRLLASHEVVPSRYDDIRQLADTVIARKKPWPKAAKLQTFATRIQRRPRVHLYAQCWKDEFMLPYFFRHYDAFVDRYVIFDDGSTDRSLKILEKNPKVEIRRFVRSDPEWFVGSEQSLSDACWKESRGSADWVIVTDVDEHLYHPQMSEYLRACMGSGVTLIPALGFQMLSETLPVEGDLLCNTLTFGAPFYDLMKVSLFRPDDLEEINFALGRDQVAPVGDVRVPQRDEVLLLHYKYIDFQQTFTRHRALLARLGQKDFDREERWEHPYSWSVRKFSERWQYVSARVVDIRTASGENYPLPRWWLPRMETVDVRPAADPAPGSDTAEAVMRSEQPDVGVIGAVRTSESLARTKGADHILYLADAIRYSRFEIEAEPNFFEFRGYNLFLHPPKIGATRLQAHDVAPGAASAVFTCALSLDDRSAGPVVFRVRAFDASQTVCREAAIRPGKRRKIKFLLDGFDGPLSVEFSTEMQAGTESNDFAWATFHDPRLTYRSASH